MARYGIGATSRATNATTPPTNPGNGSGGAGTLGSVKGGGGFSIAAARSEIGDATTGRITLAIVDLALIGIVAFYVWTRSAQGG